MMKKVLVIIGIIVTLLVAGAAAMFTYERMHKEESETEAVSLVETNIEQIEESNDVLNDFITDIYVSAAKEIFGDHFDDTKVIADNEGLIYEDEFVSWNELEAKAYEIMWKDYI